jgi:hypothetical protein
VPWELKEGDFEDDCCRKLGSVKVVVDMEPVQGRRVLVHEDAVRHNFAKEGYEGDDATFLHDAGHNPGDALVRLGPEHRIHKVPGTTLV